MTRTNCASMIGLAGYILGVVVVMTLLGCPPSKPSDVDATELEVEAEDLEELDDREAVVAVVAGEKITRQEFNRRVGALEDFARVRFQARERREDLLTRLVEFEVLADEAERRGYGSHVEVRRAIKRAMADRYVEDHISESISMADIDEEDRRAYFEKRAREFEKPERRRMARLWVAETQTAETLARRWAEEAPEDVDEAGRAFQQFVFYHSEDRSTGDFRGLTDWVAADEKNFSPADLFDREPATLHGPYEANDGYVLEMVVDVKPAHRPEFEEVDQEITRRIHEERRVRQRRELLDRLRSEAEIEIDEESLAEIEEPDPTPPLRLDEIPRIGEEPGL